MLDSHGLIDTAATGLEVEEVSIFTRLSTGRALCPIINDAIEALEMPKRDGWLANEFSLGEYGVDRMEWAQKVDEMREFEAGYAGE